MIRILTVRQPWAGAFFMDDQPKTIENRRWTPGRTGTIFIQAGAAVDPDGMELLGTHLRAGDFRVMGAIIGSVDVTGWHPELSPECERAGCLTNEWAMWSAWNEISRPIEHWSIRNPRPFVTPIKTRGQLGLWKPGPTLEGQIMMGEYR